MTTSKEVAMSYNTNECSEKLGREAKKLYKSEIKCIYDDSSTFTRRYIDFI